MSKQEKTKKVRALIEINEPADILGTTQFDKELAKTVKSEMAPYVEEIRKYKSNGLIALYKEGMLDNREWLVERYVEILGKECNLSAEKRGVIKYLCDKAFLAVRSKFKVVRQDG